MPLYNPYIQPRDKEGNPTLIMDRPVEKGETGDPWRGVYWEGPGKPVTEGIEGSNPRIIMDRALRFIENEAESSRPFFAVIWFHVPHSPIAAGKEYLDLYPDLSIKAQHWYGCLTAMDEEIGRLRTRLDSLDITDNTLLWFCSDNGPSWIHDYNSSGPFRGEKGTLWEGGIRVPAFLLWPDKIKKPRVVDIPCVTSDFYPTLREIVGFTVEGQPQPLDGVSLLPLLEGNMPERPRPIAFQSEGDPFERDADRFASAEQLALIDNRYKLISDDGGSTFNLFDLIDDPGETTDLAREKPYTLHRMITLLEAWVQSCRGSNAGKDYK
jgi:arylsulfatase A-like enzyme